MSGRPTFRIDPVRLHELRKEKRLTQGELAERAYAIRSAPKPAPQSEKTKISTYQKIERHGRTSRAMAEALAAALRVTVGVLQGDAPDEAAFVDEIEQQLLVQFKAGTNAVLQARLARRSDEGDVESDLQRIHSLAVEVAGALERTAIGQRASDFSQLVELTGWPEEKLRERHGLHGHWLLNDSFHARAKIVIGFSELQRSLEARFERYSQSMSPDTVISVREELPWFYVDVDDPRRGWRCTFSFVRCTPTPTGLQWVNPTWRDRLFMDATPLLTWARQSANFVAGPDGQVWPRDVRRLRLLLAEPAADMQSSRPVKLLKGSLDDLECLPDGYWQVERDRGCTHAVVIDHLMRGLRDELLPFFGNWPLSRWKASYLPWPGTPAYIQLVLDAPAHIAKPLGQEPFFGTKFILVLVEDVDDARFEVAPWRRTVVENLVEMLNGRIKEEAARERQAAIRAAPAEAVSSQAS